MAVLILAQHDNGALDTATLHTASAAAALQPEVDILVAGQSCGAVAEAAAKVPGIRKVLRVESAQAMAYYRARMLEPWLADIDRMEGLGEQARSVEQRTRRCLLEDRNARWLGQLQSLFQDGPSFVAVGAVHLVGPDGLLAALRRNGYRVEAMPL